jgi:hypothetical protein
MPVTTPGRRDIDESRLRVRVYLHEGLDLDAAERFWAEATRVPRTQFGKPYRAVADSSIRKTKHEYDCVYVGYSCARERSGPSWVWFERCYRRRAIPGWRNR